MAHNGHRYSYSPDCKDSAQSSRAQRRLNREAKRFGFAEVQEGEDCREPLASGTDSLEVCKVEKEKLGRKVDKLKKRVEELISIAESQQQQIETLANEKKELVDELTAVESHGRVARLTHRAEEQRQQIEALANEKKELAEQLKASEAYASTLFKDNMKFWEALTTERRTVQMLNEIIETGECQEGGQGSRLCTPPP